MSSQCKQMLVGRLARGVRAISSVLRSLPPSETPLIKANVKWEVSSIRAISSGIAMLSEQQSNISMTNPCCGCDECRHCWSCGESIAKCSFFCQNCKIIQSSPVVKVGDCSAFNVFGFEPTFDIDPQELSRRYWALQKSLHPDNFQQKDQREQELSRSNSSEVNEAYSTLKSPLLRASYLLGMNGLSAFSEGETVADPGLLMEIMELSEEADECEAGPELQLLLDAQNVRIEECVEALSRAFRSSQLQEAASLTLRLQYLTRLAEQMNERL